MCVRADIAESEITGSYWPFSIHFSRMHDQPNTHLADHNGHPEAPLATLLDRFMCLKVNNSFLINVHVCMTTFSTLAITNLATEWPPNIV